MLEAPPLHDEIFIHHIFTKLDLVTLLNARLTCQKWLGFAAEPMPWQSLLQHYFSSVPHTDPQKYQKQPKTLIFRELSYYRHWWMKQRPALPYPKDLVLSALRGDETFLQKAEGKQQLERLQTLALANGHVFVGGQPNIEEAFILGVKKGNLTVVQTLLATELMSEETLSTGLYFATKKGHAAIVRSLPFTTASDLMASYYVGARSGCLAIAEALFKKFQGELYDPYLLNPDTNKYFQILTHFVKQNEKINFEEDSEIADYRKTALALLFVDQASQILPLLLTVKDEDLFEHITRAGHYFTLKHILHVQDLLTGERAELLKVAADSGQEAIIQLLFEHDALEQAAKDQFSAKQKDKALKKAAKSRYLNACVTILKCDQSTLPLKQITGKARRAAWKFF